MQRLAIREMKEDETDFGIWNNRVKNVQDRLLKLKQMVCNFVLTPIFIKLY